MISEVLKNALRPSKIIWTTHAKFKMAFYGISESRVRRVIKSPLRVEEGIAEKTAACMQPSSYKFKDGKKFWNQEIWVMFTTMRSVGWGVGGEKKQKEKKSHGSILTSHNSLRIISAWRYPGVTKPRSPLPDEILAEIDEGLLNNVE